ncbi:MAG: Ryanodine receptor Ryr [Bacteroidales bacterium]|nr:Ryanodine receptor Ryr [Bacteroidales bacterium]
MATSHDKAESARNYRPAPMDLSDVVLPEELGGLTEAIAENTHEVWSQRRLEEGWTYGPVRDEKNMKHPCLIPYAELSESEKEYDRATAMNAIRMIVKLGFRIEKCE